MARILLTGGSGLLALNWACAMRDQHDVLLATHNHTVALAGTTSFPLPLDDAATLTRAVQGLKPSVVVHTAAMPNVDVCERSPDVARYVNVELARNVARAAAAAGARLVHMSTEQLYDGTRAFRKEEEPPEPLSVYARTKLEAEGVVAGECPGALVIRANLFGWGHRYRQSFSDWVYYSLRQGRSITMFDDMFYAPILADRIATAVHGLLERGASGVFNLVGDERMSRYEFGLRVADTFQLPKSLIQRGQTASAQLYAARPLDVSLDNSKATKALGEPLGTTAIFLDALKAQERAGRREELMAAVTEWVAAQAT